MSDYSAKFKAFLNEINTQPYPEPDLIRDGTIRILDVPADTALITRTGSQEDGWQPNALVQHDRLVGIPYAIPFTARLGYVGYDHFFRIPGLLDEGAVQAHYEGQCKSVRRKAAYAAQAHREAGLRAFILGAQMVHGLVDSSMNCDRIATADALRVRIASMIEQDRIICLTPGGLHPDLMEVIVQEVEMAGGRVRGSHLLTDRILTIRPADVCLIRCGQPSFAIRDEPEGDAGMWVVNGTSRWAGAFPFRDDAVMSQEVACE